MNRVFRALVCGVFAALMGVWLMTGCEPFGGGDGDSVSGTSAVRGNVVSFEVAGAAQRGPHESRLARFAHALSDLLVPSAEAALTHATGGPGGITVALSGPEDRSAVTADNGTFSITNLPAGAYRLRFEFEGQDVRYRGNSGQEAVITVGTNETVELLNIRIRGGHANIGNVRISRR